MLVAQGTFSHISKLNSTLGAGIHEHVAAHGMEFGSSNDFSELFHVGWLDIDNVEALVLDVEIPKIDA